MLTEFKHTLRRLRGQVIGWSIGLALYGLMMVSFYDTVAHLEGFQDLIARYPKEMLAFFGNLMQINTPTGYLDTYYFIYMDLIVGIFAISASANLLVGDEERGILDLVLAHPVGRGALFWGRWLGLVAAIAAILLIGWLSWLIPSGNTEMGLSWVEFLRPFLPLFAVLALFGALALLLSMLVPAGRIASMLSGALLVGNFLVLGLANLNPDLKSIVRYTPLYYYQGGNAVGGLNWDWLGGLLGATAAFGLLAWGLFQRRDIRVGGERSWRLPLPGGRRRKS